jgi:dedicator of cytokinesis protein 3
LSSHAFAFVSPIEICKRLKDVFDALFGLLIGLPPELQHLESAVFGALVAVLGIVQDRRFLNFKPVLEVHRP